LGRGKEERGCAADGKVDDGRKTTRAAFIAVNVWICGRLYYKRLKCVVVIVVVIVGVGVP
jgi:hypothetical protein